MISPKVSLEQWFVLQAVIDEGGFAQAARVLHRSQSSVSYTITKLQEQLKCKLLQIEGRKAVLTEAGKALLRQSRHLLDSANELEQLAHSITRGWEPEIHLVVDTAFPTQTLIKVLKGFAPLSQGTRVQLREIVLSGVEDALQHGETDILITAFLPQGLLGDLLLEIEFIAVAHPDHPLHQLQRPITTLDLQQELQLIISDTSAIARRDVGWQEAEHRWTVTKLETAVETVSHGLGFAWLPHHLIAEHLARGELKALPLNEGVSYRAQFYLVKTHPNLIGPASRALCDLIQQHTAVNPVA